MNCPACSSEFERLIHDNLEIDRCPTCRGLWFDENELKGYLAQDRPGVDVERNAAELGEASALECVRCVERPMQACRLSGVQFLKCAACSGMFFTASSVRELRAQERDPQPSGVDGSELDIVSMLDSLFHG